MITVYNNKTYRITYDAVSMVENALDNPSLIQISVVSGCEILVAPNEYGITYLSNGDFRSWAITGINTALARIDAHHIYARLQREEKQALIVFSVNDYEFDGKRAGVAGSESSEEYYYIKIGQITATNSSTPPTLKRELTYDGGYLNTPQGNEEGTSGWEKLFTITSNNLINALKRFASFTVQGTLSVIGKIVLNEKQLTGIARNDDESIVVDDETIPTTKFLHFKFLDAISNRFLRKDKPEETSHLLKLLGGGEVGAFLDSLIAGRGIGLFPNGRGQFSRLEVRDSMVVMRLIINEIQAMAGDFFFADCGCIEKVESLENNTYRLTIEKRTDTDWTSLDENDVMLSIVNTLLVGGTDYYTSWFRCVTKNRNDNTLTVVLYPDDEVPGGKNYPPVSGYNLTRKGNALLPDVGETNERAQSWMISSREGRIMFLQNVFKPILEDYNYALTIGKLPKLKVLDKLPLSENDTGIVTKNLIAENFYHIDYNGDVIPSKVDRGEWLLAVAQSDSPYRNVSHEQITESGSAYTLLEQHTAYHYGCKWGCIIDKTVSEPKWNSPGWVLLEGDNKYHLEFASTQGWQFFRSGVNTDISAVVSYGNRDITNVLMATGGVEIEWLRNTGNIPADNSWKPTYVNAQKHVIRLTTSDMGSEWGLSVRKVIFTCRVFIPIGEQFETVENYIGFNI